MWLQECKHYRSKQAPVTASSWRETPCASSLLSKDRPECRAPLLLLPIPSSAVWLPDFQLVSSQNSGPVKTVGLSSEGWALRPLLSVCVQASPTHHGKSYPRKGLRGCFKRFTSAEMDPRVASPSSRRFVKLNAHVKAEALWQRRKKWPVKETRWKGRRPRRAITVNLTVTSATWLMHYRINSCAFGFFSLSNECGSMFICML